MGVLEISKGNCWQDDGFSLVFGFCWGVGGLVPSPVGGLVDWKPRQLFLPFTKRRSQLHVPPCPTCPSAREGQSYVRVGQTPP